MDFIDNLIQTLFDIIDNLFWFSPGIGPRKIKKLNVFIASFAMEFSFTSSINLSYKTE